jgi:hypothetical protein
MEETRCVAKKRAISVAGKKLYSSLDFVVVVPIDIYYFCSL